MKFLVSDRKGISPLIAAVILIAFVIAVASIVATFFTDTAMEWGEEIGEEDPVGTIFTSVDIVDANPEKDLVMVQNTGRNNIDSFVVTLYGGFGVMSSDIDVSLDAGQAGNLDLTGTELDGELTNSDSVEVAPAGAPGQSDEMELE